MALLDLTAPSATALKNLAGMTRPELRAILAAHFGLDEKKARMRANQIWLWAVGCPEVG